MLYVLLALIAGAYIVARAVFVPFVHDEARTFYMFIQSGKVLPHEAPLDAANHLLPSFVSLQLYKLFGPAPWVLRAFSVGSFVLYAWYVFRVGEWFQSRIVRWCIWPAMLATPFVIEFFGLFRGYAPAVAFLMMFFWHGHAYMRDGRRRDLVFALLAFALAAYSNLTLLLPWPGAMFLLGIRAIRGRARRELVLNAAWLLVLAVLPCIYLADHAAALSARGELYYGTDDPWLGSLASLALAITGVYSPWVVAVPVIICVLASAVASMRAFVRPLSSPLVLLTLFVLLDMLGRMAMHLFLSTPLPLDRTAMHWVPPLLLAVAMTIDLVARRWSWLAILVVPLLHLPVHTLRYANTRITTLWSGFCVDERMVRAIADRTDRATHPLLLRAPKFTHYSLAYEAHWRGLNVPLPYEDIVPDHLHDLMLVEEIPEGSFGLFAPVERSGVNGLWLLERRSPLHTTLLLDTVVSGEGSEFLGLWEGDPWQEVDGPLLMDVNARLFTGSPFEGYLVTAVDDGSGGQAFYHGHELRLIRKRWKGEQLHLRIVLPGRPLETQGARIYLWDPQEHGMWADHRVRIWGPTSPGPG